MCVSTVGEVGVTSYMTSNDKNHRSLVPPHPERVRWSDPYQWGAHTQDPSLVPLAWDLVIWPWGRMVPPCPTPPSSQVPYDPLCVDHFPGGCLCFWVCPTSSHPSAAWSAHFCLDPLWPPMTAYWLPTGYLLLPIATYCYLLATYWLPTGYLLATYCYLLATY